MRLDVLGEWFEDNFFLVEASDESGRKNLVKLSNHRSLERGEWQ